MIKFGNEDLKKEAISLWSQSFKDSSEYVNYYFTSRYKHENFLLFEDNNTLLGGCHFNPYTFTFFNNYFSSRYLVGVATFPQFKNSGVFKSIFNFSLDYFYKKGEDLIFLTAANPEVYSNFNFSFSHYLSSYLFNFDLINQFRVKHKIIEITINNLSKYEAFISKEISCFSSFLSKDHNNFIDYLEETNLENGHIYIIVDSQDEAIGAFTYLPSEDIISVQHLFFHSSEILFSIFGFLNNFSDYYKKIEITTHYYCDLEAYLSNFKKIEKKVTPYLMSRILNPKKFIECFLENRFKSINSSLSLNYNFILKITDKDIKDNNFLMFCNYSNNDISYFYENISNKDSDECLEIIKNSYEEYINYPLLIVDIKVLSQLIFGALPIDTLLKNNSISIVNNYDIDILNYIFHIKKGYIHTDV